MGWIDLARLSWVDPAEGARELLRTPFPPGQMIEAMLLLAAIQALLQVSLGAVVPPDPETQILVLGPLAQAGVDAASMLLIALMAWGFGYIFGGTGGLADALQLTVWFNAVLLPVSAGVVLLSLLVAPLGLIALVVFVVLTVRMAAQFVAVLHGFRNLMMVALGMGLALVSVAVLFAIIAVATGIVDLEGAT